MDFINKHTLSYGIDRKVMFIKDKLHEILEGEIRHLGFEHVIDDKNILLEEVKLINKSGYAFVQDEFILIEKYDSVQKARERIFELLCSFRILFEHLGRFSLEYSSSDDMSFYLVSYFEKTYRLIKSKIDEKNKVISLYLNKEILDYICVTYLSSEFRKEKMGLIIFDDNKSEVLKIKKYVNQHYICFESKETSIDAKKEEIKSELIPYCLFVTLSLAKKNQVKLVSFVEDFEKNISIDQLDKMINLYENKITNKIFNFTLSKHINGNVESKNLCDKCAKTLENKFFVVKDFAQRLNISSCQECSTLENVFTYTLL